MVNGEMVKKLPKNGTILPELSKYPWIEEI